jgi:hypothetical protein
MALTGKGACILAIALIIAAYFASSRYVIVSTTTFNIGGVYKLDSWTGKLWLCEPTSLLLDNKTVVAPKGCYRIKDTVGDGSPASNI